MDVYEATRGRRQLHLPTLVKGGVGKEAAVVGVVVDGWWGVVHLLVVVGIEVSSSRHIHLIHMLRGPELLVEAPPGDIQRCYVDAFVVGLVRERVVHGDPVLGHPVEGLFRAVKESAPNPGAHPTLVIGTGACWEGSNMGR